MTSQVPQSRKNAIWQLFSAIPEQVQYGASHYCWHRSDHNSLLQQLYDTYTVEGIMMPYFFRDVTREHLHELPPEDRLAGLVPQDLLKYLA